MGRQDQEQAARVRVHQAWGDLVAGLALDPCPYPDHRGEDWRLPAADDEPQPGPWICGVCHAPALQVERRSDVE